MDLAKEIRSAFPAARPAPPLVRSSSDQAYFRELEAIFAATPTLDPAFLHAHAHRTVDLVPEARCWMWRALLLAALEAPWERLRSRDDSDEVGLIHPTIYFLRPNPCAVVAGRTDYRDATLLRAELDPAQRRAVSRFLGAVVGAKARFGYPGIPYLAAQAVAWCWQDDPETTAAAAAMRAEARSWQRPALADPETEALAREIERAFAATPRPTGELVGGVGEEPSDYEIEFADATWAGLAPWFVDIEYAAYSFFTPEAFRYFLPAALLHALVGSSNVDAEFHLVDCVQRPSSYQKSAIERTRLFTPPERAAIAAFLRRRYPSDANERAIRDHYS